MFFINQPLFLKKNKPLYPNPNYLLLIVGIWIWFSHRVSVVCGCTNRYSSPHDLYAMTLSLSVVVNQGDGAHWGHGGCRGCGGKGKVGVLLLQQNHWEKFFPGNACSLRGCCCQAVSIPRPTPSAPLAPPYCVEYNCGACLVHQITILVWL